jgi:hypothetical protein
MSNGFYHGPYFVPEWQVANIKGFKGDKRDEDKRYPPERDKMAI